MPRPTGPTIARWQLARELRALREAAGISHAGIAEVLGCSESKIYKMESGSIGAGRADLLVMLDRYHDTDEAHRQTLLDLQKLGKERGWWVKYGQLSNAYSMYIGLESAATTVKTFELAVVPGLLQTEDYARAIITAQRIDESEEDVDRRVRVRIARQARLTEEPPLSLLVIIEETALRRQIGGPAVLRDQLGHLIDASKLPNVAIQVLPFSEGSHPGTLGGLTILEFPEDVHSPIAYIETWAGEVYMEREDELRRVILHHTHMHAVALSKTRSVALIKAVARELA